MHTSALPRFVGPVTGTVITPGTILGYRKDGRPIYVIAGGDGTTDNGTGDNAGDGGTQPGNGDGGKPADGQPGTKPPKPKIEGELDPDRAARTIAAARDGESKAKARAQAAEKSRQDLIDSIGVALGLKVDPKTDPTELVKQATADRDKATAAARGQAIELAVYRAAGKAGGDPDALLDSRTFLAVVAELDPVGKGFADQVTAAIKDAVKANPKLGAQPAQQAAAPGRSGGNFPGAPVSAVKSLDEQIAEAQKAGNVRLVIHLQNQKLAARADQK